MLLQLDRQLFVHTSGYNQLEKFDSIPANMHKLVLKLWTTFVSVSRRKTHELWYVGSHTFPIFSDRIGKL